VHAGGHARRVGHPAGLPWVEHLQAERHRRPVRRQELHHELPQPGQDLTLERTTDVKEVFPTRFVEENSGDKVARRWYVHDFALAEIKRLDAGSWVDQNLAGTRILTFQEAIDLVRRKAGLYPELKDPEFYRQRGVNPVRLSADIVRKYGLEADPKTPLVLQSFDDATLKAAVSPNCRRSRACSSCRTRRQTGAIRRRS